MLCRRRTLIRFCSRTCYQFWDRYFLSLGSAGLIPNPQRQGYGRRRGHFSIDHIFILDYVLIDTPTYPTIYDALFKGDSVKPATKGSTCNQVESEFWDAVSERQTSGRELCVHQGAKL